MSRSVRTVVIFVAILAAIIALSIPFVARDKNEARRETTIRILASIAMAKTAYAVEYDLRDGATVTMEQLLAPRPVKPSADDNNTTTVKVNLPHLEQTPVFPYAKDEGELILEPIGKKMPVFKLKNGETIEPRIERPQAAPSLPEY